MLIDLSGRAAVVVGGGGGGIGTAAVEHLARAGADVGVITYVAGDAEDSAARVEALGRKAATQVVDVTDEAAVRLGLGDAGVAHVESYDVGDISGRVLDLATAA